MYNYKYYPLREQARSTSTGRILRQILILFKNQVQVKQFNVRIQVLIISINIKFKLKMGSLIKSIKDGLCSLKSWLATTTRKIFSFVKGVFIICTQAPRRFYRFITGRRVSMANIAQFPADLININIQQLEWQPLELPEEQLSEIETYISLLKFQQEAQKSCCAITQKVVHKPVQVKCCSRKFEAKALIEYVNEHNKCLCNKSLNLSQIIDHSGDIEHIKSAVIGLRVKIRAKYRKLTTDSDKQLWKERIQKYMGVNYVEKYL